MIALYLLKEKILDWFKVREIFSHQSIYSTNYSKLELGYSKPRRTSIEINYYNF